MHPYIKEAQEVRTNFEKRVQKLAERRIAEAVQECNLLSKTVVCVEFGKFPYTAEVYVMVHVGSDMDLRFANMTKSTTSDPDYKIMRKEGGMWTEVPSLKLLANAIADAMEITAPHLPVTFTVTVN